jgi:Holliday junction DNA helicase RuvA
MIGRLRGTLVGRSSGAIVIDVSGVGYEVMVTPRTQAELPGLGEEVVIHTHLQGREDGITLYGFPTEGDRDLFRVLLTASGVGPKLALGILGALTATEIRRAVATEDVDALTVAPGVGKRSAQKLVLELKPKMENVEATVLGTASTSSQVRQALEALGYTPAEIREIATSLDVESPIQVQIKEALRLLGRR